MRGDLTVQMPTDLHSPLSSMDISDEHSVRRHRGITSLTIDVPSSYHPTDEPRPLSRWKTPEFLLYYFVFTVTVPWMIWVPVSLSLSEHIRFTIPASEKPDSHAPESHPNYLLYYRRLIPSWLFGRKVVSTVLALAV